MEKKLWFRAKRFGWGWYPVTWQGWLVTILYAGLLFLFSMTIDETSSRSEVAFTFILPIVFLTGFLIRIAYAKGEKPSWNWGTRKKDNGNTENTNRD